MIGNIFLCVNAHHHLFCHPQYHAKRQKQRLRKWSGIEAWNQVEKYRIVGNWKTKVSLDSLRIIFLTILRHSFSRSFFLRCLTMSVCWLKSLPLYTVDFCLLCLPKGNFKLTKKSHFLMIFWMSSNRRWFSFFLAKHEFHFIKSTRWFSNRFPLLTFAQLFNHYSMKIHRNEDLLELRFSRDLCLQEEEEKKVGNISPVTKIVAFQSSSRQSREKTKKCQKEIPIFWYFWLLLMLGIGYGDNETVT